SAGRRADDKGRMTQDGWAMTPSTAPSPLRPVSSAIHRLVALIQGLTAVLMLVAVVLNAANIIGRYVFFSPIGSAEEIMLFLLVGTVFLGNSVVGWEGRQLRMDILLHALPAPLRRAFDVAADLAMIAVCVTLIVLAWPA